MNGPLKEPNKFQKRIFLKIGVKHLKSFFKYNLVFSIKNEVSVYQTKTKKLTGFLGDYTLLKSCWVL